MGLGPNSFFKVDGRFIVESRYRWRGDVHTSFFQSRFIFHLINPTQLQLYPLNKDGTYNAVMFNDLGNIINIKKSRREVWNLYLRRQ